MTIRVRIAPHGISGSLAIFDNLLQFCRVRVRFAPTTVLCRTYLHHTLHPSWQVGRKTGSLSTLLWTCSMTNHRLHMPEVVELDRHNLQGGRDQTAAPQKQNQNVMVSGRHGLSAPQCSNRSFVSLQTRPFFVVMFDAGRLVSQCNRREMAWADRPGQNMLDTQIDTSNGVINKTLPPSEPCIEPSYR